MISPASLPDADLNSKIRFRYCVDPMRGAIDKDQFGTFPVNGEITDAINIKKRKKNEAVCPNYKEVDLNHPVPDESYAAVAEVLAYVYQLKGKKLPATQRAA